MHKTTCLEHKYFSYETFQLKYMKQYIKIKVIALIGRMSYLKIITLRKYESTYVNVCSNGSHSFNWQNVISENYNIKFHIYNWKNGTIGLYFIMTTCAKVKIDYA